MTAALEYRDRHLSVGSAELGDLVDDVEVLVKRWIASAATKPSSAAVRRLAGVLKDPAGLDFTVGFIDRVIRPEDVRVAAANLRELTTNVPSFLPWHLKLAIKAGVMASTTAPELTIPVVRRALRRMVSHLLIDASDIKLRRMLAAIRNSGSNINVNLLGEAVLGEAEAARRIADTSRLLMRDDIDYVSIKVSSAVAAHPPLAFDQAVESTVAALTPLFEIAAGSPTPKFINLDMEEYRDLDLTIAVFTRLLDRDDLRRLEAGIVLQAYLPDALGAMVHLQEWAAARRARGGAGIKVRLVKGANLPMERVDASIHGWPLATWPTKQDTDANYKRVLDYALTSERVSNVRVGVAGHNLFDVAFAWTLAGKRGVRSGVEFEMLLGMAEGQARAVSETVGPLRLYVPVVNPEDFDVAIAYLVRRLQEGASDDNFLSAAFDLNDDGGLYERERNRFLVSLAAVDDVVRSPNRTQDRRKEVCTVLSESFSNTSDTDPSLPGNRQWAKEITSRVPTSTLGEDLVNAHTISDAAGIETAIASALTANASWAALGGVGRARILRKAAVVFEQRRGEFLEVMASETAKTLDQGDPEVSEAIDFLNYYADLAVRLDETDGAVARPVGVTVVTPPWNFPVAIPTGSTVAALAAGSAVIVKPATQARRCGSLIVKALWDAGVPAEVLHLVHVDEGELGRLLVADARVDRLILTGAFETAQLFRSFRGDLQLLGETSGKNAIIVTPQADRDLAVKDIVYSAFGHAGQKCSAASLAILVGSVATSTRFREQLVDAVSSLKVGYPSDPSAQMGPLVEPATGKLARALTRLSPGERWLVEPKQLDDTGRVWSPGVKVGVKRGSEFHLTEYFGPVLGLIAADSLDDAIEIQNEVDYGLTAGLHSLERSEIEKWVASVQAGNLYVNRGITGAIVRRQPFGGWKKSSVGAGTKAGGPNYLVGLSDWTSSPATVAAPLSPVVQRILDGAADLLTGDMAFLARSLGSDAVAWRDEFAAARDVSGLDPERNWLRYVPVPVTVRFEDATVAHLLRVTAAGVLAGATVDVSAAGRLDDEVVTLLRGAGVHVAIHDAAAWTARLNTCAPTRVRLLGGSREAFARHSSGRVDLKLYAQPVVEAGRIEMLTFLQEQAVAATAHRFGSPSPLVDGLL